MLVEAGQACHPAATIYHALGIDHELRLPDTQGRPVGLMDDGQPIMELFG